jgi:peptidoglycan/LPS O-acetylase OafA/YrhL
MLLVIFGHSLLEGLAFGFTNASDVFPPKGAITNWSWQIVYGAEFAVDAFLVMSGFLLVVALQKRLKKKILLGGLGAVGLFLKAFVHRYLRLVPSYGVAILVARWVLPLTSSGVFWGAWQEGVQESCNKWYVLSSPPVPSHSPSSVHFQLPLFCRWWTNLLFVNNLVPWHDNETRECIGWTWYLGVDMQCFLAGTLFALIIRAKPRLGWALLLAVTTGSLVAGTVVTAQNRLTFDGFAHQSHKGEFDSVDYTDLFYVRSWMRWPPYAVGMAASYLYSFVTEERDADEPPLKSVNGENASHWGGSPQLTGSGAAAEPLLPHSDAAALGNSGSSLNMSLGSPGGVAFPPRTATCVRTLRERVRTLCGRGMPAWLATIVLLLSISAILTLVYIQVTLYSAPSWSATSMTAYTAWSKTWFSMALAAMLHVMYVSRSGVARLLNAMLGWAPWEPLARLTYPSYLLHFLVIMFFYYSRSTLITFSWVWMMGAFIANWVVAYLVAAVLHLLVEAPCANLEFLVMRLL